MLSVIDSRLKALLPAQLLVPYIKTAEYVTPPSDISLMILIVFNFVFGISIFLTMFRIVCPPT